MHVQARIAAAPPINRVGMIEPIRSARHAFNHIQHLRNVNQRVENAVRLQDVGDVELLPRARRAQTQRRRIIVRRHLLKPVKDAIARIDHGRRYDTF